MASLDRSKCLAVAKQDMAAATTSVSRNQWLAWSVALDIGASEKQTLALFEALYVESGFHNWRNPKVPSSSRYPNDGVPATGGDLDSVGVLQQRVGYDGNGFSKDWGSVNKAMDPETAMRAFLKKAGHINDAGRSAGQLAQLTQVSGYPLRYDQKAADAQGLMDRMKLSC